MQATPLISCPHACKGQLPSANHNACHTSNAMHYGNAMLCIQIGNALQKFDRAHVLCMLSNEHNTIRCYPKLDGTALAQQLLTLSLQSIRAILVQYCPVQHWYASPGTGWTGNGRQTGMVPAVPATVAKQVWYRLYRQRSPHIGMHLINNNSNSVSLPYG